MSTQWSSYRQQINVISRPSSWLFHKRFNSSQNEMINQKKLRKINGVSSTILSRRFYLLHAFLLIERHQSFFHNKDSKNIISSRRQPSHEHERNKPQYEIQINAKFISIASVLACSPSTVGWPWVAVQTDSCNISFCHKQRRSVSRKIHHGWTWKLKKVYPKKI